MDPETLEQGTEADDDFAAGLSDEQQTETPALVEAPADPEEQPAPKYVQITEEDWAALQARAAKIDEIEGSTKKGLDKAFGSIGGVTQALNELRQGGVTELSVDDFKNLKALGFDDLTEAIVADLGAAMKKAPKAAAAPAAPDLSEFESRFDAKLAERAEQITRAYETKLLTATHPDWQQQRDTPEFQAMVAAKPAEWREQFWNTTDSGFLISTFNEFKAAQKARTTSTRRDRLAAAETPRGSGGNPGPIEKDPFLEGLES